MKNFKIPLITIAIVLAVVSLAFAEASLWLQPYPDNPDAYVGRSSDPWEHESYVVDDPEDFILDIYNHSRGNGDNTVKNVFLVVAVNDIDKFTSAYFTITVSTPRPYIRVVPLFAYHFTEEAGFPSFESCKEIPSHGVFPARYAKVYIGDIPVHEGDTGFLVPIDIYGDPDLVVHFDAYGVGTTKGKGKNKNPVNYDVHNPFSHDVTVVGGIGGIVYPPPE